MGDQFPRGKLSDEDEGRLAIAVATKDRTVLVNFGKPVVWFGMDRTTALALAENIRKHAEEIT